MWRGRSATQWFCIVGGTILLVRGGAGVLLDPEFASPGEGWHQLIHLASGLVLLAGAARATTATAFVLGFGVLYAAITLAGLADGGDVAGVIPVASGDNVLHAILATTSLGAVAVTRSRRVAA